MPRESWDPIWEEIFSTQGWGKYPSESLIRFCMRNFSTPDARSQAKILEIGCGPGANIWFLSREGFQAFGIDGSVSALQTCQKRLDAEGLRADLRNGDFSRLPYDDGSFDAVIDSEALYCNPLGQSQTILAQVHRVLKPGGKLYSRAFTDQLSIGQSTPRYKSHGHTEYGSVESGPLKNRGFARLCSRTGIEYLYGQHFKIKSVDLISETRNNGEIVVPEWVIEATQR